MNVELFDIDFIIGYRMAKTALKQTKTPSRDFTIQADDITIIALNPAYKPTNVLDVELNGHVANVIRDKADMTVGH